VKADYVAGAVFAGVLAVSTAFGQTVLFQDDFSIAGPGGVADPAKWRYEARTPVLPTPGKTILVTAVNSATYFGESDNPYLHFRKEDPGGSLWVTAQNQFSTPSEVVTVEFDFYMPSQTSWGASNADDPRIRLGINDPVASNGNRVPHEIRFGHGGAGAISGVSDVFSLDTPHSIRIVYNYSDQTVNYVGSSLSVPAFTYDVWMDGVRQIAGAGGPSTNNAFYGVSDGVQSAGVLQSVGLAGFSASEFFVDNFVVYANAIPEPSGIAAGLIGLGALMLGRRRRQTSCSA
jgi:uncharacterized protein (TIGR03382 family)